MPKSYVPAHLRVLRMPDGEPGGGAAAVETPEKLNAAALTKFFPEDAGAGGGKGGTIDLSTESQEVSHRGTEAQSEETEETEATEEETATEETVETTETTEEQPAKPDAGQAQFKAMTKRIGKLLEKLESAQTRVEELEANGGGAAARVPNEVAKITSQAELNNLAARMKGQVKSVRTMLRTVQFAPEEVESQLREMAAENPNLASQFKKRDADGQMVDDFSQGKMVRVLSQVEENMSEALEAIPERQAFLNQRSTVNRMLRESEIVKAAPFIADPDSDEYAEWRRLITASPDLRNAVNGELLAAAAVIGLKHLKVPIESAVARINGKAPAKAIPAKGKSNLPNTAGGGARGVKSTRYQSAKSQFMKTGSVSDADKLIEAM